MSSLAKCLSGGGVAMDSTDEGGGRGCVVLGAGFVGSSGGGEQNMEGIRSCVLSGGDCVDTGEEESVRLGEERGDGCLLSESSADTGWYSGVWVSTRGNGCKFLRDLRDRGEDAVIFMDMEGGDHPGGGVELWVGRLKGVSMVFSGVSWRRMIGAGDLGRGLREGSEMELLILVGGVVALGWRYIAGVCVTLNDADIGVSVWCLFISAVLTVWLNCAFGVMVRGYWAGLGLMGDSVFLDSVVVGRGRRGGGGEGGIRRDRLGRIECEGGSSAVIFAHDVACVRGEGEGDGVVSFIRHLGASWSLMVQGDMGGGGRVSDRVWGGSSIEAMDSRGSLHSAEWPGEESRARGMRYGGSVERGDGWRLAQLSALWRRGRGGDILDSDFECSIRSSVGRLGATLRRQLGCSSDRLVFRILDGAVCLSLVMYLRGVVDSSLGRYGSAVLDGGRSEGLIGWILEEMDGLYFSDVGGRGRWAEGVEYRSSSGYVLSVRSCVNELASGIEGYSGSAMVGVRIYRVSLGMGAGLPQERFQLVAVYVVCLLDWCDISFSVIQKFYYYREAWVHASKTGIAYGNKGVLLGDVLCRVRREWLARGVLGRTGLIQSVRLRWGGCSPAVRGVSTDGSLWRWGHLTGGARSIRRVFLACCGGVRSGVVGGSYGELSELGVVRVRSLNGSLKWSEVEEVGGELGVGLICSGAGRVNQRHISRRTTVVDMSRGR
ncbi:hypothetical protein Tco_0860039 [Tanacetum coccineum]|uniref:Uncharacterized protein n=1 Tax=Tanacetum coccineum TaxID=301880 RepID=A0ABQ5BGT5_9ASTR